MKPETLTALQGSVAKWQQIVDGTGEDRGNANCPLCRRFLGSDYRECVTTDDEEECPVRIAANDYGCCNTPYEEWLRMFDETRLPHSADTPERKAAAVAELEFLKSLLPEDK